jgi:GH35 family endo-1,4-beta-xylanase
MNRATCLTLFVLGIVMLFLDRSAQSQTTLPIGGAQLLPRDAIGQLALVGTETSLARSESVEVAGEKFARAIRVTTIAAPRAEWNVQLNMRVPGDVRMGDVLLAHFWLRCVESMTGEAFAGFVFEQSSEPFDKQVEMRIGARSTWTEVFIPFKLQQDFKAGEAQVCFRLGYERQTTELAGVELINYGPSVKLESLPRTRVSYHGREADAAWRKEALARIEKIRKGDLMIHVVDASGNPVAGAEVEAKQTRHAFRFGSCVTTELLTGDSGDAKQYREFIEQNFNFAVFENDMKWPAMADGFNPKTDQALAWLLERNIAVRGHNLIWPSWRWLPKQIVALKDKPTDLRRACEERVTSAVSHFAGKLIDWDVVNEDYTNHDIMDVLGRVVMVDWFKLANRADPTCRLFLNDFGVLEGGRSSAHRQHFFDSIKFLKDGGAPIGGIGIQSHFGAVLPSPEEMLSVLDQFSEFGLPIELTEASFNLDDRDLQADYMRDFLIASFSHPKVEGVMLWGFWERRHWRPPAALFSADWSIRPHGKAWMELVHKEWMSDLHAKTDTAGSTKTRGFLGDYQVTIRQGSRTKATTAHLDRDGTSVTITLEQGQ